MNLQDITAAIAAGELDGDLENLISEVTNATVDRYKVRDRAVHFGLGDRVYFNNFTARQSSRGSVGTIVSAKRTRVVVELDEPEYRAGRPISRVTCPTSILNPLPADARVFGGCYIAA